MTFDLFFGDAEPQLGLSEKTRSWSAAFPGKQPISSSSVMPYQATSDRVAASLRDVFASLWPWFAEPSNVSQSRPLSGGWSIEQVLEHIGLTNRFLMLTLTKYVAIAERRARETVIEAGESDLRRLDIIGERGTFGWPRPAHMEPQGVPMDQVRLILKSQLDECLALLERLEGGKGSLCRITMSVNALGKIDLYQWIYFIAQHARRHVQQMHSIKQEVAGDNESASAVS